MEILEYTVVDGIARILLCRPGCPTTTDSFVLGKEKSQCSRKCLPE